MLAICMGRHRCCGVLQLYCVNRLQSIPQHEFLTDNITPMKKILLIPILLSAVVFFTLNAFKDISAARGPKPDADNVGLKLPEGFGALKVADIGAKARHLVVTPQGNIYVKLARVKEEKGIIVLKENSEGRAEITTGFGNYGGTGIYLKDGYLYASSNKEVFRYKLNDKNEVIDPNHPETIVKGLKMGRQHETKSLVLDNDGNIYVNIGVPSNSCQEKDRGLRSKGIPGCPLLMW